MKKEKYNDMSVNEKLEYLIKKLGKADVLDYVLDCFNNYQLEYIANEMAEDFDLIEY